MRVRVTFYQILCKLSPSVVAMATADLDLAYWRCKQVKRKLHFLTFSKYTCLSLVPV